LFKQKIDNLTKEVNRLMFDNETLQRKIFKGSKSSRTTVYPCQFDQQKKTKSRLYDLESRLYDLESRWYDLESRLSFVRFRKSFVKLFVRFRKSFVRFKIPFVRFRHSFVRFKRSFVRFRKSFAILCFKLLISKYLHNGDLHLLCRWKV
jgi:hypothetical protein